MAAARSAFKFRCVRATQKLLGRRGGVDKSALAGCPAHSGSMSGRLASTHNTLERASHAPAHSSVSSLTSLPPRPIANRLTLPSTPPTPPPPTLRPSLPSPCPRPPTLAVGQNKPVHSTLLTTVGTFGDD